MTSDLYQALYRRRYLALAACVLLLVSCVNRAPERPREGAAPIVGGTPVRSGEGPPPTLSGSSSFLATPTPLVFETNSSPSPLPRVLVASPVASPGAYPVVSSLLPAPGSTLPPGNIVIGARITGSSDLTDIVAYVDGEAIPVELGGTSVRLKVVNLVRPLEVGSHEIRIQARDQYGHLGGYRWQFTVSPAGRIIAEPTPHPTVDLPTRTPIPVPTRRSIVTPPPTITPRAGSR